MSKIIFSTLMDGLRIKYIQECFICEKTTPLTITFEGSSIWICSECLEILLNKLMKTPLMDVPEEVDSAEKMQSWIRKVLNKPQPESKPKPKAKSSIKTIWW